MAIGVGWRTLLRRCGCLLAGLLLAGLAAVPAQAQPAWTLTGQEASQGLAGHLAVLEDRQGRLSPAQLQAPQAAWTPVAPGALNFGFSSSTWWLRLRLDNPGADAVSTVVDLQQPSQDVVDWFVLDAQGRLLQQARSGDRLPFAQRPLAFRGLALPVSVAAGQQVTLLVRLSTHDGLHEALRPTLDAPAAFSARIERGTLLQGLYFGMMVALAGYNLFMAVSLRERSFALYVAYLLSFLVWAVTFRGFGLQYLWPDAPVLNNQLRIIGSGLGLTTQLLFGLSYLRLHERGPRWVLRTGQVLAATGLLSLLVLGGGYASTWRLLMPMGLVGVAFGAVIGLWQWRRGSREGMFYSLAFMPLWVAVSMNILQLLSVLPPSRTTDIAWQLSVLFEVVVLAFGLADSVHRMKADKLAAERSARQAQQQLAARLELQVQERTMALESANRQLQALATTDELTGAYNRRHFNSLCRAALVQRPRAEALALCMFDIDHFKRYNDHYGHQAGDHALVAVVQAVGAELKRSGDMLCRLGGEEFGVLVGAATPAGAAVFFERLRLAVRGLGIPHVGNPAGVVTASFGAVWWSGAALASLSPDAMYLAVDGQLYLAKAAGRDQLSFTAQDSPQDSAQDRPQHQPVPA